MAEPPKSPPSSDIEGVNRDARVGQPAADTNAGSGETIGGAKEHSTARPEETSPQE